MILCTKSDCHYTHKCISSPPKIVIDRWLTDPQLQTMEGCSMYTPVKKAEKVIDNVKL